ncbi:hypothetical protein OC188_03800 [Anaplasma capra]|nr:hypothetical protein [Anaplasma capra]MCU7611811.1 hypothetical protein [Anaplasma capra]
MRWLAVPEELFGVMWRLLHKVLLAQIFSEVVMLMEAWCAPALCAQVWYS